MSPAVPFPQPLAMPNLLSVSMDLSILGISYQWNRTIGNLYVSSLTYCDVLEYVSPLITKSQKSPKVTSSKVTGPPRFTGRRHGPTSQGGQCQCHVVRRARGIRNLPQLTCPVPSNNPSCFQMPRPGTRSEGIRHKQDFQGSARGCATLIADM